MTVRKQPNPKPLKASEIEVAVALHLDYRRNMIVPNVKWGLGFSHELDLFVLTPSSRGWEVEIKVSKADLKRDLDKWHQHRDHRISRLYYALPESLKEAAVEFVPERAGILLARRTTGHGVVVRRLREAKTTSKYKFSASDRKKLSDLAYLRTWRIRRQLFETRAAKEVTA